MNISRKMKTVIFIVGLVIEFLFLLVGIGVMDETALIRLEGSDRWLECIGIGWSHVQENKYHRMAPVIADHYWPDAYK